jgi:hypothetical protein
LKRCIVVPGAYLLFVAAFYPSDFALGAELEEARIPLATLSETNMVPIRWQRGIRNQLHVVWDNVRKSLLYEIAELKMIPKTNSTPETSKGSHSEIGVKL